MVVCVGWLASMVPPGDAGGFGWLHRFGLGQQPVPEIYNRLAGQIQPGTNPLAVEIAEDCIGVLGGGGVLRCIRDGHRDHLPPQSPEQHAPPADR